MNVYIFSLQTVQTSFMNAFMPKKAPNILKPTRQVHHSSPKHYRFPEVNFPCALSGEEANTRLDRWHHLSARVSTGRRSTCDHWHTVYDGIRRGECHCWSLMYCQMSADPRGLFLLGILATIRHLSLPLKSDRRVSPTPRQICATTHYWRPDRIRYLDTCNLYTFLVY